MGACRPLTSLYYSLALMTLEVDILFVGAAHETDLLGFV